MSHLVMLGLKGLSAPRACNTTAGSYLCISFYSNNNKMGLCSDSTNYYRMFGPCLDFNLIPCEEKRAFSVLVGVNSFSSNQDRVGVGLRHTKARPHLIMTGGRALPVTRDGCRLDFFESGSGSAYRFRFLMVPISVPK